jgi:class 3 adenylate cyclase/tetratricopeptide (TPR) repeat protein
MRCVRCEADNPEGMKFCIECAAPLTRGCPSCGFANPPQAKFCGQCASALQGPLPAAVPSSYSPHPQPPRSYTPPHLAEKILTSRAALEGERKHVTVLFADLKGSMELLADRDPEDARAILDPVLERMMAAVHRYEGTVNQVMGDGIMALFGAPIAHEDHAVRACYAVLAMQASVKQYATEVERTHGVPMQIRVGLNSGEVVVRAIGNDLHMDYSAIGQTTHLAARMEQLARPGSTLLTAETLRLVEGIVHVTALGPVPVKGLDAPVEVFELVGASALRGHFQARVAGGLTRFVGRDAELAALQRGLAHLQAAEFLYETQLFPEHEYTFKHTLTYDVAYGSLLQERRRALHARIVAVMETLDADHVAEQIERLAHHAVRGEVWDKAVAYWRQTGARALARSANREAVVCFEHALVALQHLPERRDTAEQAIDLRFDLRTALFPLGEHGRIFEYLHAAEIMADKLNDQRRLGQASGHLSTHFDITGDRDQAIMAGQRALAIAQEIGDLALQVRASFNLVRAYYALGNYRHALNFLRRTVTALEGAPVHERFGMVGLPSVVSRGHLALCLMELGAVAEAMAWGEEADRMAEAAGEPYTLVATYLRMGLLYLRKGDLPRALPVLERGLRLCQGGNVPLWFSGITSTLGCAYALSGRVAEALPLLERAVDDDVSTGRMNALSLRMSWLSEAYVLAGRLKDALPLAERALALTCDRRERGNQAWVLRLLGEIHWRRTPPDVDQAAAHYHQALALAEELSMRPLQAHCHLGLGTLYAKMGRREQAHAALSTAIELYRAMEMTFWLPEAEAALAQVEGR